MYLKGRSHKKHLLKFVRGDRNITQQQKLSNDVMYFRARSLIISADLSAKLDIFAYLFFNRLS